MFSDFGSNESLPVLQDSPNHRPALWCFEGWSMAGTASTAMHIDDKS